VLPISIAPIPRRPISLESIQRIFDRDNDGTSEPEVPKALAEFRSHVLVIISASHGSTSTLAVYPADGPTRGG
jgi:hypothetical protein